MAISILRRCFSLACIVPAILGLATTTVEPEAQKLGCVACTAFVGEMWKVVDNSTSLENLLHELEAGCANIFVNDTKKSAVCQLLSKGVTSILPQLHDGLETLAWDNKALCAALGECTVPCCQSKHTPEQVHLSLAGDNLSLMNVMWTTGEASDEHKVLWGTNKTSLENSNGGSMDTYTHFGWIGYLHTSTMHSLSPETVYYYKVGDGNSAWSPVYSFKTFPSKIETLRVAVVGDMGYGGNSDTTVQSIAGLVAQGKVDMVIHNGDISYADGDMKHWDSFMRKVEPIASAVPYMTSPGNHEFWFNFTAYKKRFAMPARNSTQNMYYSFQVGGVHFLGLNTESAIDIAQVKPWQVNWLENELTNNDTNGWAVTFGHRPLYCSQEGQVTRGKKVLQDAIEDILLSGGVDLAIQAHVHSYERSYPTKHGKAVSTSYVRPGAPVYVVNGAAGNREGNPKVPGGQPWEPVQPAGGDEVSFGVMTITQTHLVWEQYYSKNLTVFDKFVIEK